MISGLRLRNIRSLRDTGHVTIRNINVLVGMNSSGKSTFLRFFPLLRQSAEARTKGPMLWYGRLVDFGDFNEVISSDAEQPEITIGLALKMKSAGTLRQKKMLASYNSGYRLAQTVGLTMTIGKGEGDDVGYVTRLEISIGGDQVELIYERNYVRSILINDQQFSPPENHFWYADTDSKVPRLTYYKAQQEESGKFFVSSHDWVLKEIARKLKSIAHGNTSVETLELVANQMHYSPPKEFPKQFVSLTAAPYSLRSTLSGLGSGAPIVKKLRELALLKSLPAIISDISAAYDALSNGVRYIEPIRASVERHYRLQDLAVDEIDSSGANTAMYLKSLDEHEVRSLQDWMDKILGFHVYPEKSAGHVAVKVGQKGDAVGRNVADLGFGYSQVLPVILQLWHSCIRPSSAHRRAEASIIAIEQPELHLHPRYQSMLSDLFASVSASLKSATREIPLLVETHSEHIVNRFGALVAEGVIQKEDIQILLFDQSGGNTTVKQVEFDDSGVLSESWPLGFFLPEA